MRGMLIGCLKLAKLMGIIFEAQIATKILKIVSERLSEGAQSSECDLIAAGA